MTAGENKCGCFAATSVCFANTMAHKESTLDNLNTIVIAENCSKEATVSVCVTDMYINSQCSIACAHVASMYTCAEEGTGRNCAAL